MKTEKNILIAFVLNLSFAIIEFLGGLLTNSVAILSDSIHDFGDALTIGISYFLEKKSKMKPDDRHTYGYARYSVLGAAITSIVLLVGSIITLSHAMNRLFHPVELHANGMVLLAVIGVIVNFVAARFTHGGSSLNQQAVNLHMLEDVLGWIVVLMGAIVVKITNWNFIDPIMSIGLSIYIGYHAIKNLKSIFMIFAETTSDETMIREITRWLCYVDGVKDVHHLHIWNLDEHKVCASVHVKTTKPTMETKKQIRHVFKKRGIEHVTIEFEELEEDCHEVHCDIYKQPSNIGHCCHNHHADTSYHSPKMLQHEFEF